MLVLTRKHNETLHIGNDIVITIVRVRGDSVRIGIQAPKEIGVMRGELVGMPKKQLPIPETEPRATLPSNQGNRGNQKLKSLKLPAKRTNATAKLEDVSGSGPLSKFVKPSLKVELAIAS